MKLGNVAIIMGSNSDTPIMVKVTDMLDELQIYYSTHIYSAHRTPNELSALITEINKCDNCKVIIAGAGMSAALSGAIAAQTIKPVIGIPLSGGKFNGVEAVLSTLEMPPGIPVLTVGIDAGKNAALAAASIVALGCKQTADNLTNFRAKQKEKVIAANSELNFDSLGRDSIANFKFRCNK